MRRTFTCALFLVALAPAARGQGEVDRVREPDAERRGWDVAPVTSPLAPKPHVPEYLPEEGLDPSLLPERDPAPVTPGEEPAAPPAAGIRVRHEGQVESSAGYDSNVFRADSGATSDGFFREEGELELSIKFPFGGEVFFEVSGESLLHFDEHRADEHFAAFFVEIFQPLATWLDVGVQNSYEINQLNLLNDNGDLFPRGRFGSADEEVRLFFIARPPGGDGGEDRDAAFRLRDLALEGGFGFRDKNYEENAGVESLDYTEVRTDGAISYKVARRPRSRLKLKYRFRRRDYREFRSRTRDGVASPDQPRLELHRHQVNLTWFQEVRAGWFDGRLISGLGFAYNRDLNANDRTYREASFTVRGQWWIVRDKTRLEASVRAVGRNFLVRRASDGKRLRHRLVGGSAGLWQALVDLPPEREGDRPDAFRVRVAAFVRGTATAWRSGDDQEDYDRYLVEAGLEVSW